MELADIDGNGDIDALINGVVAGDATRKTAEEVEAHLDSLMRCLSLSTLQT